MYSSVSSYEELYERAGEEFNPEKIFFLLPAWSIDTVHEVGDIVLPNVFLEYNPSIEHTEIDEHTRDSFMGKASFIETFDEQKDYYVENFGLSIGGIIVTNTPRNPDIHTKLQLAYEADIYMEESVPQLVQTLQKWEIPSVAIALIIEGKNPKQSSHASISTCIVDNAMTTLRLMSDE